MKLPANIRSKAGRYFLKKVLKEERREKRTRNFDNSRRIAILFDLLTEEEYHKVHKFVNELQGKSKEIRALGYVLDPLLANHLMPMLSFDYIYEKDLNWYYRPSTDKYRDFCHSNYDILIDISRKDHLPLLFAASETNASFKIGRFSEPSRPIFDMMLDIKGEEPIGEVIKHYDHYIKMIKPVENEF